MEIVRIDRRGEARSSAGLELLVWGIDVEGERFVEPARAQNISLSGALLKGLNTVLKSGDVIGILFEGQKARFRVVWVCHEGPGKPVQVAVHRIEPDPCPWRTLLSQAEEHLESSVKV
jgi:hypothetical protein